jgi:hypothetical protein
MSKRLKPKAELLPPAPADMADAIAKMVEQKVAEAMATEAGALFEPFFQPKRVFNEFRKYQTVVEQRKWSYYFAEWGCLVCGGKDASHASLGMCKACFGLTRQRMIGTLRRANAELPVQAQPQDLIAIAQEALAPSIAVLGKKRPGQFGEWSKALPVAREANTPAVVALKPRIKRQR